MTLRHQPTAGHETHGQSIIYDEATGRDVAIVYDGKTHAAGIVRACNSIDDLVTVVTQALDDPDSEILGTDWEKSAKSALRAAGSPYRRQG